MLGINNYSTNMDLIITIIFGAIVGWVASIITGTNSKMGALLNIIVGILGSMLGNWIMGLLGRAPGSGFNLYSFGVALGGAVILLALVKLIRK